MKTPSDGVSARLHGAFSAWRARLLDLSKRNRALNYRPTKVSTVTVVDEKPPEVYRTLVVDEKAFTFAATLPGRPEDADGLPVASSTGAPVPSVGEVLEEDEPVAQPFTPYEPVDLEDRHTDTVLQCHATPEGLDLSLRRLAELQRTSLDEQGVNTLFLALGFLHYKEAPQADTVHRAPLILVPVLLERIGARAGYRLKCTDEEPLVNPSLVEYLRRQHNVLSFPSLPELGEDATTSDLQQFYQAVSSQVAEPNGWKVTPEIVLATFAFQKLVIFKDLEQNQQAFGAHALIRRVVLKEGEVAYDLPSEILAMDIDRDYPLERTSHVLDADSSQIRAIAAVGRDHDLVIHGPPGTGKSQTITNIIADALGGGKRVLFVSEKMAALEVVHRRLTEAKLGEFCLELHSGKTGKAAVIDQLRQALHSSAAVAGGATESGPALAKTREQLNRYATELHRKRTALACSAYDALGQHAAAFSAPRIPYPADPEALTQDALAVLTDRLRQAESVGLEVTPIGENGWRDSALEQHTEDLAADVAELAPQVREVAEYFLTEAARFPAVFGLPNPSMLASVESLSDAAQHLASAPGMPATVLRDSQWATPPAVAVDLLDLGRKATALGRRLTSRYRADELDTVDPAEVSYVELKLSGVLSFLAFLDGRYRAIRRRWLAMRQPGTAVTLLDQAADMKLVRKWKGDRATLDAHPAAAGWFGHAWNGASSDWSLLDARLQWLQRFHEINATHGPLGDPAYALAEKGCKQDARPAALRGAAEDLRKGLTRLVELVHWPADYFTAVSVDRIRARVAELERDLHRGPAWVAFARAIRTLANTPAHPMASQAFHGIIPVTELGRSFRRALFSSWLERVIPQVPELAEFSTPAQNEIRNRFQELDTRLLTEVQVRLTERLRSQAQSRFASSNSVHRAFLQREMAKQRRHRPMRVTLREAGEAVAALKPCFLMSPLSVSQFLDARVNFDLVIFDEASQLPTEDAVAAICRGKHLVVVGDPKQLPPTNFFSVQVGAVNPELDEQGEPIVQETESVREEYQAAGLHQAHLEWHYRSAHQSLIQFNNQQFYNNRLIVFPAAAVEGPEYGLHFEYLPDGRYEGAGLNLVEARRVADAVVSHFRTRPNETLGVGTFNLRQQLAILDELERHRRNDPSLEQFFSRDSNEPFFVKNLENIQGDERDVIFLSITYGRQADGRLRYNFGPLNREQGWRRLNVLVSRARRRMLVFSSLRASDIDPKQVATQGPALLRDFLLFAETGMMTTPASASTELDSPFEGEVARAIEEMGYLVDNQVGVGPYRIDLGVRHRERPGVYLAGIECDGVAYHSAPCARDRDRLRQQVLERRGWTILRVWSTDWFKDRRGTIERLKRTLGALTEQLSEARVVEVPPAPSSGQEEAPAALPGAGAPPSLRYVRPVFEPYRYAMLSSSPTDSSLLEASITRVAVAVRAICEQEGPIHTQHAVDRLIYLWGHEKRGARLVAAAEAGIRHALFSNAVAVKGAFLSDGGPVKPRSRRGLDFGAELVAPEELVAALRAILEAGAVMSEVELLAELRDAMDLRRTQAGQSALQGALKQAIEEGIAVYGPLGIRARPQAGS